MPPIFYCSRLLADRLQQVRKPQTILYSVVEGPNSTDLAVSSLKCNTIGRGVSLQELGIFF